MTSSANCVLTRFDPAWTALESDGKRPWTDDYSNVIGAILAQLN